MNVNPPSCEVQTPGSNTTHVFIPTENQDLRGLINSKEQKA